MNILRIDIALDDFIGLLADFDLMEEKIKGDHFLI